jgi:hypothetical protein
LVVFNDEYDEYRLYEPLTEKQGQIRGDLIEGNKSDEIRRFEYVHYLLKAGAWGAS